MTGEQMIYALEHCKDECRNCIASFNGKSCKQKMSEIETWQKRQHEKFGELLKNYDLRK